MPDARTFQRDLVARGLRLALPGDVGGRWETYDGHRYRVVQHYAAHAAETGGGARDRSAPAKGEGPRQPAPAGETHTTGGTMHERDNNDGHTITTTARETFTTAESTDMARLVFKRFGRDPEAAAAAWRRLLQNGCTVDDFLDLVHSPVHTHHADVRVAPGFSPVFAARTT